MKAGTAAPLIDPHDPAAEEMVLGAALQDQEAAHLLAEALYPSDFFGDRNRIIFTAIDRLVDADEHVDLVTVGNALHAAGQLRDGMPGYLTQLVDETPTAAGIRAHLRIIARHGRARTIKDAAQRLTEGVSRNGDDPEDHLRDFFEMVGAPHAGRSAEPFDALPATEFLAASFTGAVRLVPSIGLMECGVGLLSGPGGNGKSLLALNLGAAWSGAPLPIGEAIPAARPLRVLMFQVEDSPGMVQERLRKILGGLRGPRSLSTTLRH